jgi:hypothetical protein
MLGLKAGAVLTGAAGSYRIDAEHGRGGFGVTYRGVREADGQPVVVKVLALQGLAGTAGWKAVELFEREAAVLRGLSHPGIPAFIDDINLGAPNQPDQPIGFGLVMEMVPGVTLRQAMQPPGLSRAQMYAWLADVLEVLTFIHGRSPPLIHRDVNPKNIILRPDGRAVLVDFGTVQAALRTAGDLATTSAGTFGYAPPEQFLGQATAASDLYGVGMTYLAVATGREPESLPLRGLKVDVVRVLNDDPRLVRLIDGMVEPDPRARITSAAEALTLLSPLRSPLTKAESAGVAPSSPAAPAAPAAQERTALRALAGRLAKSGFVVALGGERGRTPLVFHATRAATNLADEAIHIYAAAGTNLEGADDDKTLPPIATTLFAQAVVNEHPMSTGILRRLLDDRCIVVPLIATTRHLGPRTRGHLEQSLREPAHLTGITAFVDVTTGAFDLVIPRSLLAGDPDDRIGRVRRALSDDPGS